MRFPGTEGSYIKNYKVVDFDEYDIFTSMVMTREDYKTVQCAVMGVFPWVSITVFREVQAF